MKHKITSIIELMSAIADEFNINNDAPTTLDEIDIVGLKSIYKVPLPVGIVSKLQLPVEALVLLHKLNRLGMVSLNKVEKQYQITGIGMEYLNSLKPKPLGMNADRLNLVLWIYRKQSVSQTSLELSGYTEALQWHLNNTRFIYPNAGRQNHWILTANGKRYIEELVAIPLPSTKL